MQSTSLQPSVPPRPTGMTPIKTVVKCRRRGGAEIPITEAANKMFQTGNMSCSYCADDNGGQFPCNPKK